MCKLKRVACLLCCCLFVLLSTTSQSLVAQDEAEVKRLRDAFFKIPKQIQIYGGADQTKACELVEKPILNWSNPERKSPAGGLFLWTLDGRPQAALCIYPNSGRYEYEFQSVSSGQLVTKVDERVVWSPAKPGIAFTDVESAKSPASTPGRRLLGMRQIAKSYTATLSPSSKNETPLRLLPSPVFRYPVEQLKDEVVDGAMFAFVQGTDPEVLLIVETVRNDVDKSTTTPREREALLWRCAFARMTMVPLGVTRNEQPVWQAGWAKRGLTSTYQTVPGPPVQ